jgi:hypothetical protein
MRNLSRRLSRLESERFDVTGLVPHSEAWFAFWEDKLARNMDGEDVDFTGFSIEVIDRIVEAADRAERGACRAI